MCNCALLCKEMTVSKLIANLNYALCRIVNAKIQHILGFKNNLLLHITNIMHFLNNLYAGYTIKLEISRKLL